MIENGVKYNVRGGKVIVAVKEDEGKITLAIADTGIGIPKEDLENIFDRFYRVDKARSRAHGGAGLGLSIVRFCTELHKGSISFESKPGWGTKFLVSLPYES
jgi:two-component system sensor histidine kinase VicK